MLGGADNPNGELPSYITGADNSVHHIWCPLFSQEFQVILPSNSGHAAK